MKWCVRVLIIVVSTVRLANGWLGSDFMSIILFPVYLAERQV